MTTTAQIMKMLSLLNNRIREADQKEWRLILFPTICMPEIQRFGSPPITSYNGKRSQIGSQ